MHTDEERIYKFVRARLNETMTMGILDYAIRGHTPGGFLRSVFENNLVSAAERADMSNQRLLVTYASILVSVIPRAAWGSEALVARWIEHRGISGLGLEPQRSPVPSGSTMPTPETVPTTKSDPLEDPE